MNKRTRVDVLQEITLRMLRVNAPPVVDEHIEHGQQKDEERARPLGLETHGNHATRAQTDDGHKDPSNGPIPLDYEADKQEDEENTASELEAVIKMTSESIQCVCNGCKHLLLSAVVLIQRWDAGETRFPFGHGFAEDHQQSTNNRQVAQEEVEVKDETVSEALENDNAEESTDGNFCELLGDDSTGCAKHSLFGRMNSLDG